MALRQELAKEERKKERIEKSERRNWQAFYTAWQFFLIIVSIIS